MINLLKLLFFGHVHTWKTIKETIIHISNPVFWRYDTILGQSLCPQFSI